MVWCGVVWCAVVRLSARYGEHQGTRLRHDPREYVGDEIHGEKQGPVVRALFFELHAVRRSRCMVRIHTSIRVCARYIEGQCFNILKVSHMALYMDSRGHWRPEDLVRAHVRGAGKERCTNRCTRKQQRLLIMLESEYTCAFTGAMTLCS